MCTVQQVLNQGGSSIFLVQHLVQLVCADCGRVLWSDVSNSKSEGLLTLGWCEEQRLE